MSQGATRAALPPGCYLGDELPDSEGLNWLVADTIPDGGIGFWIGSSGTGKTFLVLHLASCLGRAEPFFGREIPQKGATLIVAAEGGYTMRNRILAATKVAGQRLPIVVIKEPADILSEKGRTEFAEVALAVDAYTRSAWGFPLRLIIFDTFAAAFDITDEDKATEIKRTTAAMQAVARNLSVAVVATHHYGKDPKKGGRGSSAIKANSDFIVEVPKKGQLKLTKCREAAEGDIGGFSLTPIDLGTNGSGRNCNSLCVQPRPSRAVADFPDVGETKDSKRDAVGLLLELVENLGGITRPVEFELVRAEFYGRWPGLPDNQRRALNRAVKGAVADYGVADIRKGPRVRFLAFQSGIPGGTRDTGHTPLKGVVPCPTPIHLVS